MLEGNNKFLAFDNITKRFWYYSDDTVTLYNMNLDGSDIVQVSVGERTDPFTVDGLREEIYFIDINTNNQIQVMNYNGTVVGPLPGLPAEEYEDVLSDVVNG